LVKETIATTVQVSVMGKKEYGVKAKGKVRIFNFARTALNLRSISTTLSVDGKKYILKDPLVSARVSRDNRGVLESQNPEVVIEAVSPGEDYNLPIGTKLEIRNSVFGSQPGVLYAEVSSEVVGGNVRYVSSVSTEDISTARQWLASSSVLTLSSNLSSAGESVVPSAVKVNLQSFYTEQIVGSEASTVTGSGKAQVSTTAWKTDDLAKLALGSVGGDKNEVKF
jgi:hypothetical protein